MDGERKGEIVPSFCLRYCFYPPPPPMHSFTRPVPKTAETSALMDGIFLLALLLGPLFAEDSEILDGVNSVLRR